MVCASSALQREGDAQHIQVEARDDFKLHFYDHKIIRLHKELCSFK